MIINLQYKLKENPILIKYLRENSSWYKYLNRNITYFKHFEDNMKERYKLRTEDKLSKLYNSLDTISKFMDMLN